VVGAAVGEAVSRTEIGVRSHKRGNHEDRRRREHGDRGDSTADRRRVSGWNGGNLRKGMDLVEKSLQSRAVGPQKIRQAQFSGANPNNNATWRKSKRSASTILQELVTCHGAVRAAGVFRGF
jgi:hypothetical protein